MLSIFCKLNSQFLLCQVDFDLSDVRNKLALNEACESKWAMTPLIMQPISASFISIAIIFGVYYNTQLSFKRSSFLWMICFAQWTYHVAHLYIHIFVDMQFQENQDFWNPILVFFFAFQSATLASK